MKKKNGFVFVETIITTVVLLSALLYIYGTYSSMIREEKRRLYFDDISYVYKTQIIKEILEENISTNFSNIVNSGRNSHYISVFNYGSDIFKNIDSDGDSQPDGSELLQAAKELYNYGQIFYLDAKSVGNLKACLRGELVGNSICEATENRIKGYADTNFREYLEKLDISKEKIENTLDENNSPATGILIVLYYKSKNGNSKVNYGTYENCVLTNYNSQYGASATKISQVKSDYKTYFTMQCENAYYISWAYFNAKNV